MPRNPTNWSNNDVKLPAPWSGTAKTTASWSNNITKVPAVFTPVIKNNTAWNLEGVVSAAWLYDDATQKYDDTPVRGYDYLTPSTNEINSKLPTAWAVVI
jgi:hypothetical protein